MLLDSEGWNILGYSLHYLHRKPLLVPLPASTAVTGCITCTDSRYWLHYLHRQLLLVALSVTPSGKTSWLFVLNPKRFELLRVSHEGINPQPEKAACLQQPCLQMRKLGSHPKAL